MGNISVWETFHVEFHAETRKYSLYRPSVSSVQVLPFSSASDYLLQIPVPFPDDVFFSTLFVCIYFVDSSKTLIAPWQKDLWKGWSIFSFGQRTFKSFISFQKTCISALWNVSCVSFLLWNEAITDITREINLI